MDPYVELTLRKGNEVVDVRRGKNIWVNTGRQWLRNMLTYSTYSPLTAPENRRIAFMGFGVGGFRQGNAAAHVPPMSVDYPGTNVQTDMDPLITNLERPVRVIAGQYLRELAAPTFPLPNIARFAASFASADFSYGAYTAVPLSEIGLFLAGSNTALTTNSPVAYDTFDTCLKVPGLTLDVVWLVSV